MRMSLEEYAKQHQGREPQPVERARMQEAARTLQTRKNEAQEVQELKAAISLQLEKGNAPQYILYSAITAIGILTHAMTATYNEKLRRQLTTQIRGYRRIEKALTEALQAVDALDALEP